MQAAARRLSRWATVGAVAALLTGVAGAAEARPWHGWWHGHYWGPNYVTVAPYYRPYYAPPAAVYAPPVYGDPGYVPYAAPGMSFNFTVPLR